MVQMNPTVGDLDGNVREMIRWVKESRKAQADMVIFPELALTGYPPEDLVLRPSFLKDTSRGLARIIKECKGIGAVIGCVQEAIHKVEASPLSLLIPSGGRQIWNAAAIVSDQRQVSLYAKMILPNYGVFDESRYFCAGNQVYVHVMNGVRYGINICEDIWSPDGPTRDQVWQGGAEVIVNINASPYQMGKRHIREQMLATRAREHTVAVAYTNLVGGQDELVFDGHSLLVDPNGDVMLRGKGFEEDLLLADINVDAIAQARMNQKKRRQSKSSLISKVKQVVVSKSYRAKSRHVLSSEKKQGLGPLDEIYAALVLGVRDYVKKNRFMGVLIGMSGGIDSALTAMVASDALGPEKVQGVFMPSPYTSRESREDVKKLMKSVGAPLMTIPISGLMRGYAQRLAPFFHGRSSDTTEENLQARIRGNLLMALSNKFGHLVLTTGNKSEMSVGYATLYGDMAGGFAVIKDVSKTLVYELVKLKNTQSQVNQGKALVPLRMIERPPSAELRPNQQDQDSLPPYRILDPLLQAYVEEDQSFEEMVALGYSASTVKKVMQLVDRSEYKRRQAPIGIKITQRALGKDRRMPITNRYSKC
jgi:NAD+ synthase (glutamine-hydrolysing)